MKLVFKIALIFLLSVVNSFAQDRREIGNLVMEGIPEEIPSYIEESYERYSNVRGTSFEDWDYASDGMYVTTRAGEVTQVFYISSPGSELVQMTSFSEPVGTAYGCPDPAMNGFIYYKDEGGNENYQIYFFDRNKNEHFMLTDGKSRNSGFTWNKNGTKYIYRSNKNDKKTFDFYLADFGSQDSERLLLDVNESGWGISDWSDDGDILILKKYISRTESELYTYRISTSELQPLIRRDSNAKISYGDALFAHDNTIFLVSDEGSEFAVLKNYNPATGEMKVLTPDLKWDVDGMALSDGGRLLCFKTNENGFSKVYLMDVLGFQYNEVTGLPQGTISGIKFSPDNKTLGLSMITPTSVRAAYVYDIDEMKLIKWSEGDLAGLNEDSFVAPEAVWYPTFDEAGGEKRKIPALVYRPKNTPGKSPVIISIHGGPEGQSDPTFSSTVQFFVNELGAAVIEPNVRGSSGYGKTFLDLDNGMLRENSVKDIGALLDWIETQPDLDPERVAVMGGSYGGYMVLASLVHYSSRIKCGIDVVGISNFNTFLKNTSEYRVDLRRVEYGDETDPAMRDFLESISPNNHIEKITSPLFIIQGLNDPRVPVTEAEQMLKALKDNGREVWYLMAKDEGHGFSKKSNRNFMIAAEVMFLEKYLLK